LEEKKAIKPKVKKTKTAEEKFLDSLPKPVNQEIRENQHIARKEKKSLNGQYQKIYSLTAGRRQTSRQDRFGGRKTYPDSLLQAEARLRVRPAGNSDLKNR
jgi:hypothetical protein